MVLFLGIKGSFDELFDGFFFLREILWGFRVLIGQRRGLIWDCKKKLKNRFSGCLGVV